MTSPAQSFSTFTYRWTYDIFLSFRGEDTRYGFTGNLYNALRQRGIHTFIDEVLRRGEEITLSLLKVIENSRMAIVILSENYASSTFCLTELTKILECIKEKGRLVWPIFYHVDPSEVRHQGGTYGKALAKHERRFKDDKEKTVRWRLALSEVANRSGWHFKQGEYEYKFIERIVKEASMKIDRIPLHVANYPVGLESEVLQVNALLNIGSDDGVNMVGIYGMGGIGKTTISRAVYNMIADPFEGLCFLDDVRESSIKHGLTYLQETLLYELFGEKDIKLGSVSKGISLLKHRLQGKKVLVIIDDVDKLEQLQTIAGGSDWFGCGSKIIITTRDKHLLECHGVEALYEVQELNEEDALELFTWNAFKKKKVDSSYAELLDCAVSYACRLPLALEVIGSNLLGKKLNEWNSVLDKYQRIPNKEIHDVLRVSYDALEEEEQEIFLDIACYFKGDTLANVKDILSARHCFCPEYGIGVLTKRSLISIGDNDCVIMHDLIQDMGREIVRQESPKELGERSRLWFYDDILQVLEENRGSDKIEVIVLDLPRYQEEVTWNGKAFKKMTNLRMLIIRNGIFSMGPKHLPNSLRVLEWRTYPSSSLPSDFCPRKLVILKLIDSWLQTHKPTRKLEFLHRLDFRGCRSLIQVLGFSGFPNLEELCLDDCTNLIEVDESIGFLVKLRWFSAAQCTNLRSLAPAIKWPSLEYLNLSGCSSLQSFPVVLETMENLREVNLCGTAVEELWIQSLIGLERLKLNNCKSLREITVISPNIKGSPSSSLFACQKLQWLDLLDFRGCESLKLVPDLSIAPNLTNLLLDGCSNLTNVHESVGFLHKLRRLSATNCIKLRTFVPAIWLTSLEFLNFSGCSSLQSFPEILGPMKFIHDVGLNSTAIEELPISFSNLTGLERSISFSNLIGRERSISFLNLTGRECFQLFDCKRLREIGGVSENMKDFTAINCPSLRSNSSSTLLSQALQLRQVGKEFFLTGARIPEWFDLYNEGNSLSFWVRNKFPAIALCVVGEVRQEYWYPLLEVRVHIKRPKQVYPEIFFGTVDKHAARFDVQGPHTLLFDLERLHSTAKLSSAFVENEWNEVKVSCSLSCDHERYWGNSEDCLANGLASGSMKWIGVHLYKESISMEDIRFQ